MATSVGKTEGREGLVNFTEGFFTEKEFSKLKTLKIQDRCWRRGRLFILANRPQQKTTQKTILFAILFDQ